MLQIILFAIGIILFMIYSYLNRPLGYWEVVDMYLEQCEWEREEQEQN